ncbi:unnamed protein product [Pedinophyceae sp. YPF-701]|nr:unnamed protein product [Pedinophyceae sp. YPF-701]
MGCGASKHAEGQAHVAMHDAAAQNRVVKASAVPVAIALGAGLMAAAQEAPFVAPAAALLAAVASFIWSAKALKDDAAAFAETLKDVERILLASGDLSEHRDVIAKIETLLDEALRFVKQLSNANVIYTALFLQFSAAGKFDELRTGLQQATSCLSTLCAIDTTAMLQQDFRESRALRAKLEALGGPAAVAADPEKLAALRDDMDPGSAVLSAQLEDGVSTMHSAVASLGDRLEARIVDVETLLEARVADIVRTAAAFEERGKAFDAKAFCHAFPIAGNEAERMRGFRELGLLEKVGGMPEAGRAHVVELMKEALHATEQLRAMVVLFDYTNAHVPIYVAREAGAEGEEFSAARFPVPLPRKTTGCQGVLATSKPVALFDEDFGALSFGGGESLDIVKSVDVGFVRFCAQVQEILESGPEHPDHDTLRLHLDFGPKARSYLGVPLRVRGTLVGTVVLMGGTCDDEKQARIREVGLPELMGIAREVGLLLAQLV